MNSAENKVFIITGEQGAGKTNLLNEVVELLRKKGVKMQGFIAKGYWSNGMRSGFDLKNINSGELKVLCTDSVNKSYIKIGRFYFNPETIKYGEEILKVQIKSSSELIVIDEIGLFELQGKLWSSALQDLLINGQNPILITVRINFLEDVISYFNLRNVSLVDLGVTVSEITNQIYNCLKQP